MNSRLRRLALIGIWIVSWLQVARPYPAGAISNFTYDTKVRYRVESTNVTSVTEDYAITNNTSRQYLTELKLSTPVATLTGLSVTYDDGATIPASTSPKVTSRSDLRYEYQEIDIRFPRQNYGLGRVWKFHVSYQTTSLAEARGGSHTVYVPSIEPGDPGDQYQVTVDVPTSFGTAHFTGAKSTGGGISGGRQYYVFDKSSLVQHSLALTFGDSTIYNVNFKFPLKNDSALPQVFTVTLPPDLNNQHSYVNTLTPKPLSTRLDADGNVLADYRLAGHHQLVVETGVESEVKYLEYDLSASKKISDTPAEFVRDYTAGTKYWQTDGEVAAAAQKLVKPDASAAENVKAIYSYVIDKLSYNKNKIQFNIRQGALAALQNPTNVICLEYADLTIAMLRSQGIPARMPIGYAYSGNLKATDSVADSLHAWVEVYVAGIGWMTLDPTWGEKFDNFGKSDLDHMAFAVWGGNDQLPGATMRGRTDLGYQYEATSLDYHAGIAQAVGSGSVESTRYVLLPFLSFDRITARAVPQVASDNNTVALGSLKLPLGSLAPGQVTSFFHLQWGSSAMSPGTLQLYNGPDAAPVLVATGAIRVSWLAMLVLAGLLLGGGLIWFVLRLRARKRDAEAPPAIETSPPTSHV